MKIPSYLKYTQKKFNSLSKIKYIIERCLFKIQNILIEK